MSTSHFFVNALPCKTQMLQIVTLRGDYQYIRLLTCVLLSSWLSVCQTLSNLVGFDKVM